MAVESIQPKQKPIEGKFDKQEVLNFLEASGFTADEAKRAFDAIFIAISAALHDFEEVRIEGLGKWYFRKQVVGKHGPPSTWKGQTGPQALKWRVAFKPADIFKMLLADNFEVGEWFHKRHPSARKLINHGH